MTHHDKDSKKKAKSDPYAKQRKEDIDRNKFIPGYQTPDVYAQTDEEKYDVDMPCPPAGPSPPTGEPQKPTEGVILHEGWGAKEDPGTWRIVHMKDKPELFKVVDNDNTNVITDFSKEEIAQQYIDWAKHNYKAPPPPANKPEEGEPDEPDPTPEEPPVVEPVKGAGPYAAIGKQLESTQRGPTVRHYASGKPDDKTIEKNVKGIKFDNYQFIVYVTMKTIEHDDSVSLKYGGTHMGSGWFDTTVFFKEGRTGLGTEEKHPSADLEIEKGPKIGSILNKKLGVAGVYFKKQNKIELWTDLGSGWVKQVSGIDVGGFNPKSEINEAQLRIDGFEDEPDIHSAVVQEIAAPTV